MPVKIRCACGNVLLAPEERMGQTGKCPACDRSITVELSNPKAEKTVEFEDSLEHSKKTSKSSFICRALSALVYLSFAFLLFATIALHTVKDVGEKFPAIAHYKESLLAVKEIQSNWVKDFIKYFTGSKKTSH